jgi:sugar lactone lactonase YvrE
MIALPAARGGPAGADVSVGMGRARCWFDCPTVAPLLAAALVLAACAAPPTPTATDVPATVGPTATPVIAPTASSAETWTGGIPTITPSPSLRQQIGPPNDRAAAGPVSPPLPAAPTQTVPRATALPATSPVEQVWAIDGQPNAFARPSRLAIDGQGALYIMDTDNHRVQKFDRDGRFLAMWGGEGKGEGQFTFRTGIGWAGGVAADATGNIYVADANHRIQKFDAAGQFVLAWGSQGRGDGQLLQPGGMTVDGQGNVYVADAGQHRVQKFDPTGRFLLAWGGEGTGEGQLQRPWGVAVDRQGNVYVTDISPRLQKFDPNGRFLTAWGGPGNGAAEFRGAFSLAIDGQGLIYAGDLLNHRIQVFNPEGNYLGQWGEFGDGVGQFRFVGGVAVDDGGAIYAVDTLNSRLLKFRPRAPWPAGARATPTPRPPTPTLVPTPTSPPPTPAFMTPTDR